jgi:UDP-N-acetylmuramate dehydrogenase
VLPVIVENVPLAPLTTLGLGGTARFFADIADAAEVAPALAWARDMNLPVFILGGGSNLVVADEGFAGLVLRMRTRGRRWSEDGAETRVQVEAGEAWDDVVAEAVARNAAVLRRARVLERESLEARDIEAGACGFGYRDSLCKREPERYVILSVTLGLAKNGAPSVRYSELATALGGRAGLADVREAVLALRRKKSMVFDEADPNHRSAGSFFTNPVVTAAAADDVVTRAGGEMPRLPLPDGRVKLAAGWLIEHAGLAKGFRLGPVGISSRHALALVHHGGGTTKDLLRLALHVRTSVFERFGISLVPEPVFLGLTWPL